MSDTPPAEIYIDVVITSAHRLPHVHSSHRCHNMHGHDFTIRIAARGTVRPLYHDNPREDSYEAGMVADYDRLLIAWKPLCAMLDHHVLNEVEGLENPTCENLAIWILRRTPQQVCRVEVSTTMPGGRGGCVVHRVDLAEGP